MGDGVYHSGFGFVFITVMKNALIFFLLKLDDRMTNIMFFWVRIGNRKSTQLKSCCDNSTPSTNFE